MGISERKERDKQEMRRKIIEAAATMFLDEGYDRTSIRNIADKIEYSPATIYLYYKDKDELLYEVQKEYFTKLHEEFVHHCTAEDPFEKLRQICKTYVRFGVDNPQYYDLMFIIRAPMNVVEEKEMWTNGEGAFEFLLDVLGKCMEKDCLRYEDIMTAALSIWAMGHGLISLNIRCRLKVMNLQEDMIPDIIDHSIETFLKMIRK